MTTQTNGTVLLLSGTTDHFTSFSVLVTGKQEKGENSQENSEGISKEISDDNMTIIYVACGVTLVVAAIMGFVGMVLYKR